MTRSCLSHSNFPLNRSVSRPACAFAIHLSIFKPKTLDISESEIRQYPLDDLSQCSQIQINFLFAIVLCTEIILIYFAPATRCNNIITCYCAWSVTFGWSSTSNISGQLQRCKILPGKLKVQWNHWNGSVGPSWHNLFYKTVRAEAKEPGSEISSTGNSSLSSESAFFFQKLEVSSLKI